MAGRRINALPGMARLVRALDAATADAERRAPEADIDLIEAMHGQAPDGGTKAEALRADLRASVHGG